MKSIIESINLHKKKSVVPIVDNQMAYIPTVEDDQIEYMPFYYIIEGKRYLINQGNQCCFRLRYLRKKTMPPRKALRFRHGRWPMQYLVDDEVIYPFMLFVNGRFIPWEMISIVTSQDNFSIIVNTGNNVNYISLVRDVKFAQIVSLPSQIQYVQDYGQLDDSVVMSFDQYGMYESTATDYIVRCTTDAHHIVYKFWETTEPVNAFTVMNNTEAKLTEKNIILFKNGLLASGDRKNIVRAYDDDAKNNETGYVAPCLELETDDDILDINPGVKFDSSLLTIGDGTIPANTRYDFGIFINTKYTVTADNLNKTSLEGLAPHIQNQTAGADLPFLKELQVPFEMSMDRNKSYDQNVVDCIKTMMSYNASLFNSVIAESSNLVIEEHDGQWILDALRDDGTIVLSRQHSVTSDEYMLMLVNGELYQYYNFAKYKGSQCTIPIQGINAEDHIEILRFQNVNNYQTEITVNEDDGYQYYSSTYINEDMVLFSTETDAEHFEFPADGLQHFPVDYTLDTDENGLIKITLTNPFYYGKKLVLVYKNRFLHYTFHLQASTDPEYFRVDLGNKFMYCHEYSKYMVFYNGRRLGSDHYRLVLPVRDTTPFTDFQIYLTMPIADDDVLDVIYVPSLMRDIILIPSVPTSGEITLDKSLLDYGLSTDLYMVWVNGKKIPKDCITDIDSTHLRITSNVDSTEHVCITKYIPGIDVLTNAFKENEALWDTALAQLTTAEVYALLGITGEELINSEPSVYDKAIDVRVIMYELIRDQYVTNNMVDASNAFIYDYIDVDTTAIEAYDPNGIAILPVADANRTDNLSDVAREWP